MTNNVLQLMTRVLGYSALRSGAGLLPMMATFAAVSFASGPLYERFHAKVVVSCGAAAIAAGIFVLSIADRGSSYLVLVPGMLVLGIGIASDANILSFEQHAPLVRPQHSVIILTVVDLPAPFGSKNPTISPEPP